MELAVRSPVSVLWERRVILSAVDATVQRQDGPDLYVTDVCVVYYTQ